MKNNNISSASAAAKRIAAVPPSKTLIDRISDEDWAAGVEGSIEVGALKDLDRQKLTARRENGPHHDLQHGGTYGNFWVVRDQDGNFVDWDQYSNDLRARYPDLTFIDE
jgi:hypothetical protein